MKINSPNDKPKIQNPRFKWNLPPARLRGKIQRRIKLRIKKIAILDSQIDKAKVKTVQDNNKK